MLAKGQACQIDTSSQSSNYDKLIGSLLGRYRARFINRSANIKRSFSDED